MDTLSPPSTSIAAGALLAGVIVLLFSNSRLVRKRRLPPGPRRLPLIGNAHQMPKRDVWSVFADWGKIYGDIVHVDILGKPLVILNSSKVARDLLDKRSVHYDESFTLLPYGENWRKQRRIIAQEFSQNMISRYHTLQEKEAAILVRHLIAHPSELFSQIKLRIGTIIIRVAYGYYVKSSDDPFLTTPLAAMANFAIASTPGNFLVDFIPARQYIFRFLILVCSIVTDLMVYGHKVKHIPRWMPGSGFLKTAEEWHKILWDATWNNFEWSKKNLDTGKALLPNLCATYLREEGDAMSENDEMKLVWAAATIMGGGLDTNMSTALTFYMAMILHPHIQAKAQAELDTVVGTDRLPCIADMQRLPYIRSIMTEVFRWSPGLPLSIPHATSQDDVYEGYDIPKGAIIMPNVWGMLHNPDDYPNPMDFTPERFNMLDSEMKKVTDLVFGFGRRVCPGQYFAEGTFFAIVATTLATCDILPGLDENGNEVLPKYAYTPGTIMFPEPFTMRIRPRSEHAKMLLSEVPSTIE
ncbi:hypothetical protein CVT25_007528 [Psilocybe cyanescens]|uniref:Cytochrome P450 n=1 Tax=Psilocybe cyanescens TaxID=93625 RepID=A0A409XGF0_PSICY|nr:hypothetical protein CVT25_007528 [Psilocybe cyanescens]